MKKILKTVGIGFLLTLLFLILTFPIERLEPKIAHLTEKILDENFGTTQNCSLEGLGISWTLGLKMDKFECSSKREGALFSFRDLTLHLFPFSQSIQGKMEGGEFKFGTNIGFSLTPTRVNAEFKNVEVKPLAKLGFQLGGRFLPNLPIRPELEGKLNGKIDLPVTQIHKGSGQVALTFEGLKLPQQPALDFIGLTELKFNQAQIQIDMNAGKLNFKNVELLSDLLSGRVAGDFELNEQLDQSVGNALLKWKVQKSDALLASFFGQKLANGPCPNPDGEGFCSYRVNRLSDLRDLN